jgi:3-hydroxyisobutyrate dehydrogenase
MGNSPQDVSVGFIGLGIMGEAMAGHLQAAGHPLHVSTRTRAKAERLLAKGAVWHDGPGKLAAACDVVITMVGYPSDVEEVYLGKDGLVPHAKAGAVLIDMTTSSPSLAVRIAAEGATRGVAVLDAPVSGGDVGAREARLSIMVGGDAAAFERVKPILETMGKTIMHQGGPGAGQHTKMANQIVIASTIVGVCEGLAYAKRTGLDPVRVLENIGGGAAGGFQLNVLGARMLKGDFGPGFYVHHFIKDLGIALDEAERHAIPLPGLAQAKSLFERLAATGGRELGTQGLFTLYAS